MRSLRLPCLCLLFCPLFLPGLSGAAEAPWRFLMEKDGIRIFGRPVPGSGIAELRAVTTADAGLVAVGELLRDVPACTRWLPGCLEAEVADRLDANNLTAYLEWDAPWPLYRRDIVLEARTAYELERGRAVVATRSLAGSTRPERERHVRIADYSATYILSYLSKNKTGIVFLCRFDPGGSIPDFLVNWQSKATAYETLMGFKKEVREGKYRAAAQASPDAALLEKFLEDDAAVKNMLRQRLSEVTPDKGFIDMLLDGAVAADLLENEAARAEEALLMGCGSREGRLAAARELLAYSARVNGPPGALPAADAAVRVVDGPEMKPGEWKSYLSGGGTGADAAPSRPGPGGR